MPTFLQLVNTVKLTPCPKNKGECSGLKSSHGMSTLGCQTICDTGHRDLRFSSRMWRDPREVHGVGADDGEDWTACASRPFPLPFPLPPTLPSRALLIYFLLGLMSKCHLGKKFQGKTGRKLVFPAIATTIIFFNPQIYCFFLIM